MTEPYANSSPDAAAAEWLLRQQQSPNDPLLAADLQHWLQQDPRHQQSWQRAQQAWQLTAALAPEPLHASTRQRWRYSPALAASAMLALMLGYSLSGDDAQYRSNTQPMQVMLDDGTQLVMDAGTALDVSLGADSRQLRLKEGRVFLQVSPEAQRPFQVHTDDLHVTVTGTAFLVDSDSQVNAVQIREGQVQVARQGYPDITLNAGQKLSANNCRQNCVGVVETADIAGWQSGYLTVENQPLAVVLAELNRYHQGHLWLRSQTLGQKRVTGRFNLSKPEAALRAALAPHHARITPLSPWLTIISE